MDAERRGTGCPSFLRKSEKSDFAEIARISDGTPGNKTYVDKLVKAGKTYIYQVCVFRTRADGTTQVQTGAKRHR